MAEEEHFCKFLSYKSLKSYLLELNRSVTNKIQTKSNTRVERFSIIFSFNHGRHSEKIPNFGYEYFQQSR